MVGFFGFGSPGFGASLGFGYGNVGWVPLAPYERYRPWYGGRRAAAGTVVNTNIECIAMHASMERSPAAATDFDESG
jgi:hypothetical protein